MSPKKNNKKVLQQESLLNCIGEGVYALDLEGNCFYVNPAALRMLGLQKEDLLHMPLGERIYLSKVEMHSYEQCDWLLRANGEKFPAKIIATPLYNGSVLEGTVVTFIDISDEYQAQQELLKLNKILQTQAITDTLTQTYNQRYFKERGMFWFDLARHEGVLFCLVAVEIDNFVHIKKSHGTEVGDLLIKMVAQVLKARVQEGESVARVGCEEFVLILGHAKMHQSLTFAKDIIEEVRKKSVFVEGANISCTVSVGIVEYSGLFARFIEMLKALEVKLHLAKESGGDCLRM